MNQQLIERLKEKGKKRRKKPPKRYEQRLVLFLDFLGFKELVAKTTQQPEFLEKITSAIDKLKEIGFERELAPSQRLTQFSDSVVLSYSIKEESGVFWMLDTIALSIVSLAHRGFLVRGAITFGDLYHTKNHVVGPALVAAYELESKTAVYPRVLVDPGLVKIAKQHRSGQHTEREEASYVRSLMTKDADGQYFIDYVSWKSVVEVIGGEDDLYGDYIATLSSLLKEGLNHVDARVVEKYLWLHPQYLAALELIRSLPEGNAYRRQSPQNCELLEAMDDLQSLATAAKKRVAAFKKAKKAA